MGKTDLCAARYNVAVSLDHLPSLPRTTLGCSATKFLADLTAAEQTDPLL